MRNRTIRHLWTFLLAALAALSEVQPYEPRLPGLAFSDAPTQSGERGLVVEIHYEGTKKKAPTTCRVLHLTRKQACMSGPTRATASLTASQANGFARPTCWCSIAI